MAVVYLTSVGRYVVEPCSVSDVDTHFNQVVDNISDTDIYAYKSKMLLCVEQGSAFKLGKSFLYLYKESNSWFGASVYADKILELVLLMVGTRELLGYRKIKFIPHKNMLSTMKSLLDRESIRQYRTDNKYVSVRVDELLDKFAEFFKLYKVDNE